MGGSSLRPQFPLDLRAGKPGGKALDELKENIDAEAITLPAEVVGAIDAIHARITNPGQ